MKREEALRHAGIALAGLLSAAESDPVARGWVQALGGRARVQEASEAIERMERSARRKRRESRR